MQLYDECSMEQLSDICSIDILKTLTQSYLLELPNLVQLFLMAQAICAYIMLQKTKFLNLHRSSHMQKLYDELHLELRPLLLSDELIH